jgi:tyrosyl-DNA phosphodiesterase 2
MTYPLAPTEYFIPTAQWQPLSGNPIDYSKETELSLATYNVWFGETYFEERAQALLGILCRQRPHIIGLQEVTPLFLKLLLDQTWVQDEYWVSDCTGVTVDRYGVLMLGRLPVRDLMLYELPSLMGRMLLAGTFTINNEDISVGTVHLESLDETFRRKMQLQIIFDVLEKTEQSVLMGDFNFDGEHSDENAVIPESYQDVWSSLYPDDAGYTKDSRINTMRWHSSGRADKVRYDRLIVRSDNWQPKAISRLGMEPILPHVFPSDHFGLLGILGAKDS